MFKIVGPSKSVQIIRLSTGLHTFKPGRELPIKECSESDIKHLHSLGYRLRNTEIEYNPMKVTLKDKEIPKGVTIIGKPNEVEAQSRNILTRTPVVPIPTTRISTPTRSAVEASKPLRPINPLKDVKGSEVVKPKEEEVKQEPKAETPEPVKPITSNRPPYLKPARAVPSKRPLGSKRKGK